MDHNTIGSPETAAVAERIRALLEEAHRLATSLPDITVNGREQPPIALMAVVDVYDAERLQERGTQTALCARGFQLTCILVQRLLDLPIAAQQDIIARVIAATMASRAAVAEN